ncbi:MAG TPA: non-homologous end-joining DNA ligase [Polyangiaceae bacterium]|nr:non-homologous end-joining DNA ligase [Polyangiaceae bacterium]
MSKEEAPFILSLLGHDHSTHDVAVTHPSKPYFTKQAKLTKLDIVQYYVAVAEGALTGIRDRPIVLKRFVNGAEAEPFYQKRAPDKRPSFLRTVVLSFPSGRTAEEVVVDDVAGLAWVVNLGCIELHPHAVRSADLDHPDELRIDLDPGAGVDFADVRRVALEVKALLEELGLTGFVKTSGSRGIHVNAPIEPKYGFTDVRRAALAFSREVERRAPSIATSKWWKEERHGVFLDYNQNAKDRTTSSAFSVRPLPDARVSMPLRWDEVADVEPADFTVLTAPKRFAEVGNLHAGIDAARASLDRLIELAERDDAAGLGDAPWPPHYRKMDGEAPRVAPSRARRASSKAPARSRKKSSSAAGEGAPGDAGATGASTADASTADAGEVASPTGRRRSKMPLIVVAQSTDKAAALAGLERWKTKHAAAAARLAVDDVLIDAMRGRSSTWTRVRVNLRHVPEGERPAAEPPDPDDDPTREWREAMKKYQAQKK